MKSMTIILLSLSLIIMLFLMFFRYFLFVVTVEGISMMPSLLPGDKVLVLRYFSRNWIVNNMLVVLEPYNETVNLRLKKKSSLLIKRVKGTVGDRVITQNNNLKKMVCITVPKGHVYVLGDNLGYSIDSRLMGTIPIQRIKGIVINIKSAD
jgi:signal peptidase I